MTHPITIRDVRMYPDGKLYELSYRIEDPDDQEKLKLIKETLDIQHWSNIRRMLNSPEYEHISGFVSNSCNFKIVKPKGDVAWIVPDDGESPRSKDAMD